MYKIHAPDEKTLGILNVISIFYLILDARCHPLILDGRFNPLTLILDARFYSLSDPECQIPPSIWYWMPDFPFYLIQNARFPPPSDPGCQIPLYLILNARVHLLLCWMPSSKGGEVYNLHVQEVMNVILMSLFYCHHQWVWWDHCWLLPLLPVVCAGQSSPYEVYACIATYEGHYETSFPDTGLQGHTARSGISIYPIHQDRQFFVFFCYTVVRLSFGILYVYKSI